MSMPADKAKGKGDLENGKEDDEDDRFSEIPAITTRRSSSMRSDVSESQLSHLTHLSWCNMTAERLLLLVLKRPASNLICPCTAHQITL